MITKKSTCIPIHMPLLVALQNILQQFVIKSSVLLGEAQSVPLFRFTWLPLNDLDYAKIEGVPRP